MRLRRAHRRISSDEVVAMKLISIEVLGCEARSESHARARERVLVQHLTLRLVDFAACAFAVCAFIHRHIEPR
jgi:hypothetical protein